MKIYSNVLTDEDLYRTLPKDVLIHNIETISRPRIASRGWTVYLMGVGARHTRRVNSGTHGGNYHRAASYDDHGEWFARLFAIDPNARISWWKNRDDFTKGTKQRFAFTHIAEIVNLWKEDA